MTTSLATLLGALAPVSLIAEGGGLPNLQILMIPLMFAVIYFMVLRPMSNQEKERKKRIEAIKKGDKIVLQGGILGRVSSIDDTIAVVEIADKVKIRVLKKEKNDTQVEATKDAAKDDKKDGKKDAKAAS